MSDFFQANVFRKYGTGHAVRFHELAVRRLRSWGFTTVANWSSPEVWRPRHGRDQAERAAKFGAYMRAAAAAPQCVGAH